MINFYISKYGKRLYGLCMHLCANPFEADDLYQETWLKVIKNYEKYDKSKEFEPWLTKICVNLYRNNLKRLLKSPFIVFKDTETKDAALESVTLPEDEDYSEIHEAIKKLPEKLRVTIILFYFQELDIESTAKVLDVPSGTVKSRLNKARKLLKEALKDEEYLQF